MGLSLNLWQEVDKPKSLLLRFATNPKTPAKKLVGVFCFYFFIYISMNVKMNLQVISAMTSSDWFWSINKSLVKEIWFETTFYLQYLLSNFNYFLEKKSENMKIIDWENYFFRTAKDIEDDTWLSRYQQDRNREKLEKLWVIKTKLAWVPAKTYFTIDTNKYISLFETSLQKTWKLDYKKLENKNSKNFETYNKNINNKNINNNSIVNNTKSDDFENTNLSKDDFWEKKELSKEKKREDIDLLIQTLKNHCSINNISYDKTRDRQFWKHIMDWKEFWEFVQSIGQNRIEFALNILKASIKINYWKWICSWPMKIYQNYSDVYNRTLLESKKKQEKSKVAFIPWIYQDDKN